MKTIIELRKLNFFYRDETALKDIDLIVNDGESVAVIGPNGSGKSSLLKIINGIEFPQSGVYLFDGIEINPHILKNNAGLKQFHKRVGFVFQNSEAQLFCPNVFEEIAFGPRQMLLDEESVNTRVSDCLGLLGIDNLKHREPYHLSEGEKKKVAIASVLSLNPDVLTLDEPMDGLDPRVKRFMKGLLLDIHKAGKTIICATHEFDYIEGIFERIVVLSENHTVIRDGKPGEILADSGFLEKHNLK